jgi:hypothetical protein
LRPLTGRRHYHHSSAKNKKKLQRYRKICWGATMQADRSSIRLALGKRNLQRSLRGRLEIRLHLDGVLSQERGRFETADQTGKISIGGE